MKRVTRAQVQALAGNFGVTTALVQAVFYIATGIWPWLSMPIFLKVTGPKQDLWLVKTLGALITVVGVVLGVAALRRRVTPEIALLAAGSAGSLAGADLLFVSQKRIPPIYLLDMVVELGLAGGWYLSWRRDLRLSAGGGNNVHVRH